MAKPNDTALVDVNPHLSDEAVKAMTFEDVAARTEANINASQLLSSPGLKPEQVAQRLARDGPNCMTETPAPPLWKRFFKHLLDPMLILLMIAGVLSFASYLVSISNNISDIPDISLACILFVLVFATAFLSFYQEGQAESAMKGFANMLPQAATVRRGGAQLSVFARDLVIGDIVILQTGDKVPADIALIHCRGLRTDLSSMTGEALPVKMRALQEPATEGECLALCSSKVMMGTALGIVIRIGDKCTIGMIANLASQSPTNQSTLRRNVEHFVKLIAVLAVSMASVMFVVSLIKNGFRNILQSIVANFIVILVANVPEGLPAAVSGCLAVAARKMAEKKVLVKKLEVLDTLGAVTTICTDKTGTLTQNHMAVAALYYDDDMQPADSLSHPRHAQEITSAMEFHDLFALCFKKDPLHCAIVFSALCNQAQASDYIQGQEPSVLQSDPKLRATKTLSVGILQSNPHLNLQNLHNSSSSYRVASPNRNGSGSNQRGSLNVQSPENYNMTLSAVSRVKSSPIILDEITLKRVRTMPTNFQDSVRSTRTTGNKDALRKETRVPRSRDVVSGNASDIAMFCFTEQYLDVMYLREEIRTLFLLPFSSERKWMASIHGVPPSDLSEATNKRLLIVKGALERVLIRCSTVMKKGEIVPLTEMSRQKVENACSEFAKKGERVLVIAMATLAKEDESFQYTLDDNDDGTIKANFPIDNLTLVACLALHDPPKVGVAEAVLKCQSAGIRVIMITGDHPATAEAIARHCNIIKNYHTKNEIAQMGMSKVQNGEMELAGAAIVTGSDIDNYTEEQWTELLDMHEIVFARTSPVNKLQIVDRLQKKGEIVAMTGDGVNDSPALRRADVGIAMGLRGHDVARDAADIVLMDDDFCTIVNGIEEGRLIFDNLRKIIAYTLCHLTPEVFAVIITLLFGMPTGLNSFMILAIDLGTEVFPSLSLSYEEAEDAIMQRPPRDDKVDRLVSRPLFMYSYLETGLPVAAASIFAYLIVFYGAGVNLSDLYQTKYFVSDSPDLTLTDGRKIGVDDQLAILASAQSAYLATIVFSQFWHIFQVKTRVNSVWKHGVFNNRLMNAGVLVEIGMLISFIYIPFLSYVFGTGYQNQLAIWLPHLLSMAYLTVFNYVRKFYLRKDLNSKFSQWFGW